MERKETPSRLAVFEHVSPKGSVSPRNFSFNKKSADSTMTSDCEELVIDDEEVNENKEVLSKKSKQNVKSIQKPLTLICSWDNCTESYNNYKQYMKHVEAHVLEVNDEMNCLWEDCSYVTESLMTLARHISFHGYHTKLKNIGDNISEDMKLPNCVSSTKFTIPEIDIDYRCEWKHCNMTVLTIFGFLEHTEMHVLSTRKYHKTGQPMKCEWKGCNFKASTKFKLTDHLSSHTKEKSSACSTCGNLFSSKTKFIDHRNRQLPIELRSYQCSQCSKLFPSERLLRDHMRSHINHYKCSMCDMTCPKPSNLAKHIRYRHLEERPFKCNLCDHACVTKENLESHLISHCAEKLIACEECDFRCRSICGLDHHYQVAHGQGPSKTFECHSCQKQFTRGNSLTKHLINVHGFYWPSGHSRFRYKEDTDGIFRLQTVRYESLEVTQEMMRTNASEKPNVKTSAKFDIKINKEKNDRKRNYMVMVTDNGEENVVCKTENNILITINDIDAEGKIVKSETVESNEIVSAPENIRQLRPRKKIAGCD